VVASLFTSQTPVGTNNSDGAPGITVATTVRFAQAGWVTAVRFYATTTVSGTYTGGLWQVTANDDPGPGAGTLLASKVLSGSPTAGAWNLIVLDTPVAVTTGVLYRVGVHSSDGRYVNTASFFTADVVNGDITADATGDDPVGLGTLRQGTFTINAALSYPLQTFNASAYFADVDFVLTLPGSGVVEPQVVTTSTTVSLARVVLLRTPAPLVVAATPRPLVVTAARPGAVRPAVLLRTGVAGTVPAESTPEPIVVTSPARPGPGQTILARARIVDLLAAVQPLVVAAAPPPVRRGGTFLIREPVPAPAAGPPGPVTEPLIVTASLRPPASLTIILAAPRTVVCDCTTTRPAPGVTTRPSSGTTTRPCSCP
jgi:Domain of unknown function (DUF4082)